MIEHERRPPLRRTWGGHRARPEGDLNIRVSGRALTLGPLIYLVGMLIAGILAANFLVNWLLGVLLFALLVAALTSRDAIRIGIPGAHWWGLAAGFIPMAGLALYLVRRVDPTTRA